MVSYVYNDDGTLASKTDAKDETIEYDYDDDGRGNPGTQATFPRL